MPVTAYLALGSNLGDRMQYLSNAIQSLERLPATHVVLRSSIYETDPVGYLHQDAFLNAAVKVETELSASALLGAALGIEAACGRVRTKKDGPRTLDIDLLFYGEAKLATKELTLPHPRLYERAFVLVPLSEIFPAMANDRDRVGVEGVRLFSKEWPNEGD